MIDLVRIKDGEAEVYWSYSSFYPSGVSIVPIGDMVYVAFTEDSPSAFHNNCSTDKYVYSLFSGISRKQGNYRYVKEIYVVNWDGDETYIIDVDTPINRIAIAPDDQTLYGLTEEYDIVKFDISNIK